MTPNDNVFPQTSMSRQAPLYLRTL